MKESYFVSCGTMPVPFFVVNDEPRESDQADLENYFASTLETFHARLEKLADLSHPLDIVEEKELIPLLETLINVKEMIRLTRGHDRKKTSENS